MMQYCPSEYSMSNLHCMLDGVFVFFLFFIFIFFSSFRSFQKSPCLDRSNAYPFLEFTICQRYEIEVKPSDKVCLECNYF